jgi:hypothetical protein
MPSPGPRHYVFYAEANFLTAHVDGALPHVIPEQGFQRLPIYGGNQNSPKTPFAEAGVVSVGQGYTSVSGSSSAGGWTTIVSSAVDDLNIAGVITADHVAAQITTMYPLAGNVPTVSFPGTKFVNLKIQGKPVIPVLNLNMCSPKPPGDAPYISDAGLLARAQAEYQLIATSAAPPNVAGQFAGWSQAVVQSRGKVDCSLATAVQGIAGMAFGHVVVIPGVANVYLAELAVGNHIELTMIRVELTSLGKTQVRTVTVDTQGHGMP